MFLVFSVVLVTSILAVDVNEEILSAQCDCRDWYGGCHLRGEKWIDEETWNYECEGNNGCSISANDMVSVGENRTVEKLWHSCTADHNRLKYESEPHCEVAGKVIRLGENFKEGRFQWLCLETGRWVIGCYYSNETHPEVLLKIGEIGYNGLIKHIDYPGRVQYYSEVRNDVHVKHPTNKGINKNFQEPADLTLKDPINRWQHESAALFVSNEKSTRAKIRFLPASRSTW